MNGAASKLGWNVTAYASKAIEVRLRATLRLVWKVRGRPGIDDVHELRVSCRRLRAAIALFDDLAALPPLGEVDAAARRLARVVGPVREFDVAIERLSHVDTSARDSLVRALRRRRRALVEEGADRLGKRRRGLEKAIVARIPLLREGGEAIAGGASEEAFTAYLVPKIAALEEAARARAIRALERAASGKRDSRLHRARIAIKRWRYAEEIAREALPTVFGAARERRLKRLQELGGATQDYADLARTVRAELRRLDASLRAEREMRGAIDALRARAGQKLVAALAEFTRKSRA